jgi:hypothetical protein
VSIELAILQREEAQVLGSPTLCQVSEESAKITCSFPIPKVASKFKFQRLKFSNAVQIVVYGEHVFVVLCDQGHISNIDIRVFTDFVQEQYRNRIVLSMGCSFLGC